MTSIKKPTAAASLILLGASSFFLMNTAQQVSAESSSHEIDNPGFETGDLSGWEVIEGDAFSDENVTSQSTYWEGVPFNHEGDYHLWGAVNDGDNSTGRIKSSTFELAGTGQVSFLLGGGNNSEDLYVALVDSETGEEVMRASNDRFNDQNGETYRRFVLDASDYLGKELHFEVVNDYEGGWGHINVDDFQTYYSEDGSADEEAPLPDLVSHWSFDEGDGDKTLDGAVGYEDDISYVFNDAVDKPSTPPLWREGISGEALLFDGYSTWIEREAADFTELNSTFTIETWVAPRAYEWGNENKKSTIINQHDPLKEEGFNLGMGRHGSWSFEIGMDSGWFELSADEDAPLEKNEWSHVAAVLDGDNNIMQLFLNGEKAGEKALPSGSRFQPSDEPLRIGKHNEPALINGVFTANMFNGLIDELKIHGNSYGADSVLESYDQQFESGISEPQLDYDRSRYDADRHRPQYHLISPEHWMNEPHAPFYYEGRYHIFYQHNPQGPYWNHIHWGHAVSDDMIHWEDMPIALAPIGDSISPDGVWSGDAAFNKEGEPVLLFTAGDDSKTPNQMVGLAESTFSDDGNINLPNWNMHDEPVNVQEENLHAEEGEIMYGQFRDPYVWEEDGTWYQLVSSGIKDGETHVGGTALLYTSEDLYEWEYEGPFFTGDVGSYPATGHVWELPVFLPLKDEDGKETDKYAFFINPWYDGYSEHDVKYVWHWIGEWDRENNKFVPDHEEPRLFDYGEHFTGPSGFENHDGRSILYSIAQDRRSEQAHYDAGWAHNAGLPLSLTLTEDNELGIAPIEETENLRGKQLLSEKNTTPAELSSLLKEVEGDTLEINLEIENVNAEIVGLNLRESEGGEEKTMMYYNFEEERFGLDRNQSSLDPDVRKGRHEGELKLNNETLEVEIFLDRSMIEAYAEGKRSLTSRVYPTLDAMGIDIWTEGGEAEIVSADIWEMNSAYGEKTPPMSGDSLEETPNKSLPNHDFQTGDLSGWEVTEGDAFQDEHITDADDWGWGGSFNQAHTAVDPNHYHYWGFNPELGGDELTGEMRSEVFTLGGNGRIDFLISGGRDEENLYAALIRADDETKVKTATGNQSEQYRRVSWDMSDDVGEEFYFQVVDNRTEGFGHINLDNVNIPVDLNTTFDNEELVTYYHAEDEEKKEKKKKGKGRPDWAPGPPEWAPGPPGNTPPGQKNN
ncbi:GH32 C-terminal domain-containing protein [Alkalicoccus halolimnae]|uniref:beta-fructofuranosidase n=1 Tax=Alkalicoccus halolimnae TaxID=1667239 RepID=A0A5C7FJH7_9BACI|nr:GH32 C-terminal domain-containing protein [Alkalicoccus halolimnae]TXF85576.1 cycloinulo-oligosaccharide fructanotransferase [Alkalicoccus halolimnae]